jgi:putative endonuclease
VNFNAEFMYFSITMPASQPNYSQIAGLAGESAAAAHLVSNGYRILERNWRFKRLEVDIIAEVDNTLVFVEVKTRKNSDFGAPESFVTRKKQAFLIAAAHQFITSQDKDVEARFDVISVHLNGPSPIINHLPGAFRPLAK